MLKLQENSDIKQIYCIRKPKMICVKKFLVCGEPFISNGKIMNIKIKITITKSKRFDNYTPILSDYHRDDVDNWLFTADHGFISANILTQ
ncbi:hypothetical protein BpHYR1_020311 [Brachionus plicatilis]|uniref:Uncharacterized protein n=1 Tax=Brachionus plicatilis TaxID=10195 RepID=A0A3M7RDA4_BRAPC|nr:hypothetical protein BpHYR1_020311 [Brachionus plicatilis]